MRCTRMAALRCYSNRYASWSPSLPSHVPLCIDFMKYLHTQIRVGDFEKWKSVMEDDAPAQEEAGLHLIHLWRSIDSPGPPRRDGSHLPGQAFFVMEVKDIEKARAYFNALSITWAKKRAGVHQYEWHFTEEVALPVS